MRGNGPHSAELCLSHPHRVVKQRALLASYGMVVENVTESDGEWAAARWRRGEGLSLADRLCLSLAHRLQAPALTADAAWGQQEPIRQIR